MHGIRLDRILTGMAVAVLTVVGGASSVLASRHAAPIEAAGPILELGKPPQPEAAASSAPQADDPATGAVTNEGLPLPEPSNFPPPTIRDIGDPALANLGVVDIPIVEKLRDLVTSKQLDRTVSRRGERDAVAAFYARRSFVPTWIENGAANARAEAAITHLKAADADGLDPADYATPEFKAGAEPNMLAEAELRLTAAVLTYARHAQTGRVHFSRISSDILYNLEVPEPADILAKLVAAENVGEALASYNPPHAGYKALKAKLAEARGQKDEAGPPRIANGPLLKIGMQDERVPLLRERLGISGGVDDRTYDKVLAEAVKKFQQQRGLSASGNLNSATIDALNGPRRDRNVDVIIANMERWRWMPRDLGKAYSMLNIPDFTLKVMRDGATVWKTKVVVGKASTPTPIFSDTMKFITVNPTWNVPPSIVNNEYLPALQQDPTVLDRMGVRVARNPDGSVRMYQPPGDRNALGRLRFNFPNKFIVYQHDTPDKYLFDKTVRAYSHGCMRVQDPLKYAEILLSIALPRESYTQERLRKMFGPAEVNINFPAHIPVHITYQTAFVDDAGKLVIRDDVYGRDARVLAALKSNDRRNADVAVPVAHHQDGGNVRGRSSMRRNDARKATGGQSFFGRFFR